MHVMLAPCPLIYKSNGCIYPLDSNLTRFEARKDPLMHMMLGPCPPIHKSSGCNYLLDLDLTGFEARKNRRGFTAKVLDMWLHREH